MPLLSHEEKLFMDETMPNETIKSKYSLLTSLPIINTKLRIEGVNLFLKKETIRTSKVQYLYGWGGRIRTYGTRYQKPLPYHLATPQHKNCLRW